MAYPELSRRQAQAAIEKGQVSIDGRVAREPGERVAEGAEIRWDRNRKATPKSRISLPLLYADEHLLIVDKPAGLLSVPTSPDAHDEDTALARVLDYARHRSPRKPFAGAVHRLDRDTSGALAFALDPETKRGLRALFADHHIERKYVAIVIGSPRDDRGTIDAPIHEAYAGGRRRIARPGEPSREAVTRYEVRERFEGGALLEVQLETGRQHQIRLHLAHIGLQVLGDPVYTPSARPETSRHRASAEPQARAGRHAPDDPRARADPRAGTDPRARGGRRATADARVPSARRASTDPRGTAGPRPAAGPRLPSAPRQMLHAQVLAFVHPRTGASIRVESPLPEDFRTALARLKRAASSRRVR